jgi:tetratricopeptide (TPR) repeat protein
MTYLATWQAQLQDNIRTFAPLVKEQPNIDQIHALIGASILWGVREANKDDAQKEALQTVCAQTEQGTLLLDAVEGWHKRTELEALKELDREIKNSTKLKEAVGALLAYFIQDLLTMGALSDANAKSPTQQNINVNASVEGANVLIGSQQVVVGDLIINQIRQILSACPIAPEPPGHFAGREKEFAELAGMLATDNNVAVTAALHGMGGIGKTSLVQAFCHQDDAPFDVVLWASITPTPNAATHLSTWGRYFRDDYQLPVGEPLEKVAPEISAYLTDHIVKHDKCGERCLVVFDDVWKNAQDTLAILKKAIPKGAKTLMTTRDEKTADFLKAKVLHLEELNEEEAFKLLSNLRYSKYVTDEHLKRLIAIVKGHPLTLEIASASLNQADDADAIEKILSNYQKGLNSGSPFDALMLYANVPPALTVVFEQSYLALSEHLQKAFQQLGVLANEASWTRPIAQSIWQMNEEQTEDAHNKLRLHAFISRDDKAIENYGTTFYQQHPLLRAYARALLDDTAYQDTFAHYTDHITAIARGFDTLPLEAWTSLEPYLPHVDAVGDTLAELWANTSQRTDELTERMGIFSWQIHNYLVYRRNVLYISDNSEGEPKRLNWLKMGLDANQYQKNQYREARTLYILSHLYDGMGNYNQEKTLLEQTLKIYQELEITPGIAVTQSSLADLYVKLGRWDDALDLYEKSLKTIEELKDTREIAVTQSSLADLYVKLGRWDDALDLYEKSLKTIEELKDTRSIAVTQSSLADLYVQLGRWDDALDLYEKSLKTIEELKDTREIAVTQSSLADLYVQLGRWDDALDLYEKSLKTIEELKDTRSIAVTQSSLADLYVQLGRWDDALDLYEKSLKTIEELKDTRSIAVTQSSLADLYVQLGRWDDALDLYEKSLKTIEELKDTREIAVTQSSLADLYVQLGRWDDALDLYEKSLKTKEELKDTRSIAVTQSKIADLYVQLGRWDDALDLYEKSLKTIEELKDTRSIAVTQSKIADLYVKLGRWDDALDLYEKSLKTIEELKDTREIAVTQSSLADLYVKLGRWDDALDLYEKSLKTIEELKDTREIAVTQSSLADLYVKLGRWDDALDLYEKSLKTIEELKDTRSIAVTQSKIADLYVQLGRWDDALDLYEKSLKTIEELKDTRSIAVTQSKIADLYVQLGRWDDALDLYEKSLKTIEELKDTREIAVTQSSLADLYVQLGRWDDALDLYEKSLKTKEELKDTRSIAVTQSSLADLYVQLGRWDDALDLYEKSLKTIEELKDTRSIAVTQSSLADLYVQLGRWDDALDLYEKSLKTIEELKDTREIAVTQINLAQHLIARKEVLPRALQLLWEGYLNIESLKNSREIAQVRGIIQNFVTRQGQDFDTLWQSVFNNSPKPDWLNEIPQNINQQQLDAIVQNTVAVCTIAKEKRDEWRTTIQGAKEQASANNHTHELAFFEALLLVVDEQEASLDDDNPYKSHLDAVLAGIEGYDDDAPQVHIAPQELQAIVQNTVAVRTFAQESRDEWRETIQGAKEQASANNHTHELAFFEALLLVMDEQEASLPDDNPYKTHLDEVLAGVEGYDDDAPQEQRSQEQPSQEEVMQILARVYREQGEDAVREMLAGNPDKVIEQLITQLAQASEEEPSQSTLPIDLIQNFTTNTVAVKAQVPDKLDEWQTHLRTTLEQFKGRGADWTHEVAWVEGLLAVLRDEEPVLAENNPYTESIKQTIEAIKAYQSEHSDDETQDQEEEDTTMSDDKNQEININAPIQAGNALIGSSQEVHGNVTITVGDMTQTIQGGNASEDDKVTLEKLVEELRQALASVPATHEKEGKKVVKRTEELVSEVSEPEIDADGVESKAGLLKKAAEDIKGAMPAVLAIATQIIVHATKMAGV